MPNETSIPVSQKTLKFVNEWKAEFAFKSLDEAVESAVRWGRLFSYIDSEQRRSMIERISDLEFRILSLENLCK